MCASPLGLMGKALKNPAAAMLGGVAGTMLAKGKKKQDQRYGGGPNSDGSMSLS